jgi:hypothetical protein
MTVIVTPAVQDDAKLAAQIVVAIRRLTLRTPSGKRRRSSQVICWPKLGSGIPAKKLSRNSLNWRAAFISAVPKPSLPLRSDVRISNSIRMRTLRRNRGTGINAETAAILASLCLQHGVAPETIKHSVNGPIAVALDHFTRIGAL